MLNVADVRAILGHLDRADALLCEGGEHLLAAQLSLVIERLRERIGPNAANRQSVAGRFSSCCCECSPCRAS